MTIRCVNCGWAFETNVLGPIDAMWYGFSVLKSICAIAIAWLPHGTMHFLNGRFNAKCTCQWLHGENRYSYSICQNMLKWLMLGKMSNGVWESRKDALKWSRISTSNWTSVRSNAIAINREWSQKLKIAPECDRQNWIGEWKCFYLKLIIWTRCVYSALCRRCNACGFAQFVSVPAHPKINNKTNCRLVTCPTHHQSSQPTSSPLSIFIDALSRTHSAWSSFRFSVN